MASRNRASELYSFLKETARDDSSEILSRALILYRAVRTGTRLPRDPYSDDLGIDPRWPRGFEDPYWLIKELSLEEFMRFYFQHKRVKDFPHFPEPVMSEILPDGVLKEASEVSVIGADAFLLWITGVAKRFPGTIFRLTTSQNVLSTELLKEIVSDVPNVELIKDSYYKERSRVDGELVLVFPYLCSRSMWDPKLYEGFEEPGALAMDRLLDWMREGATLYGIISDRLLFSSKYECFRKRIVSSWRLDSIRSLPEGILLPYSRMKLSCLEISKLPPKEQVELVKYSNASKNETGVAAERSLIPISSLLDQPSWTVDRLMGDPEKVLLSFLRPGVKTTRLKDLSLAIFRGRDLVKAWAEQKGEPTVETYKFVDLGDIQDDRLMMDSMREIQVIDPRRVTRYEVFEGDVLIACRGSSIKLALVPKSSHRLVISSNLICVRPKEKVLGIVLKAFLQSQAGKRMLETLQEGALTKMLNPKNLESLPIPLLPDDELRELAGMLWLAEDTYAATVRAAEEERRKAYFEAYDRLGLLNY